MNWFKHCLTYLTVALGVRAGAQSEVSTHANFTFHNCSIAQAEYFVTALQEGQDLVKEILSVRTSNVTQYYKLSSSDLDVLEKRYFGVHDEAGKRFITDLFDKIDKFWYNVTWQCSNDEGDSPTIAATISPFLEPQPRATAWKIFFTLPHQADIRAAQSLSQKRRSTAAAILVHEMAHTSCFMGMQKHIWDLPYNQACTTEGIKSQGCRWTYGEDKCQNLALIDPEATLYNADNFMRYFMAVSLGRYEGLPPASSKRPEPSPISGLRTYWARHGAQEVAGKKYEGCEQNIMACECFEYGGRRV